MKKRLAILLTAMCSLGAFGVASAHAEAEYFYYENTLASKTAVTGAPRSTLYFVGAYTKTNHNFCVGASNHTEHRICWEGVDSATLNFGETIEDRGWLYNSGNTAKFIAEERW